jgi:hypothetical protein
MGNEQVASKTETQEPSMDDILASIRRILAEDGEQGATSPGERHALGDVVSLPTSAASETGGRNARPLPTEDLELMVMDEVELSDEPDPPGHAADEPVFVLTPAMRIPSDPAEPPAEPVVSATTAESATDVLAQLAKAILDRRDMIVSSREVTLEGMVREMLRPLLQEWLDRNLPYLIERLVKKELDLMVNRAERLDD